MSYGQVIRKNRANFEEALTKQIRTIANVTILRISKLDVKQKKLFNILNFDCNTVFANIQVQFNDNSVDVYFYLYEQSSFYGNGVFPKETSNQG